MERHVGLKLTISQLARIRSPMLRPRLRLTRLASTTPGSQSLGQPKQAVHPTGESNSAAATKASKFAVRRVWGKSTKKDSTELVETVSAELGFGKGFRDLVEKVHPVLLRDCCTCPKCVDPSTKQKTFQTTDIPFDIKPIAHQLGRITTVGPDVRWTIRWENDINGFGSDHISEYSERFLRDNHPQFIHKAHAPKHSLHSFKLPHQRPWDRELIEQQIRYIQYQDYMNDDRVFFSALHGLQVLGLVVLKAVPESEKSVEDIAGRIGYIRDTFYGRTWDVKSVPEAKNVAYTHQFLGLHMDLLYMKNPPGFQLLHCLKNSCQGGESLFSDSFNAVSRLKSDHYQLLRNHKLTYHYLNAGEHYRCSHPVIEQHESHRFFPKLSRMTTSLNAVNFSPPFQAPILTVGDADMDALYLRALKAFTEAAESPESVFKFKLQEGDCVMFNNRRVLHGRSGFETATGERWLKGTYVDTDVFESRYRVMNERFPWKAGSK